MLYQANGLAREAPHSMCADTKIKDRLAQLYCPPTDNQSAF
ncbi:hypothetical protein HMPREF1247_0952 [Atopobium sp. BV3Ac4]|nr:hypothetical protein HMPREF1247_0952 [Atopobium sp. BV3Ac4]